MNKRLGAKSHFAWILCLFMLIVSVGGAVGASAHPAMADDSAYDIPQNATQAWIDVESAQASEAGVEGMFNDISLAFKTAPSGVTAVVDVSAMQGKQAALQLQASGDVKARVAVTFADGNDEVVAKYASNASIAKAPTTVKPGQQEKPVSNRTDEGADGLTHTGASVFGVVVGAVLIAAAGLLIAAMRHNNAKPTAGEEDAR